MEHGFTGTEEEWLESLRGPQGEQGEPGKNGADGGDGKDGNGIASVVSEIVEINNVTYTQITFTFTDTAMEPFVVLLPGAAATPGQDYEADSADTFAALYNGTAGKITLTGNVTVEADTLNDIVQKSLTIDLAGHTLDVTADDLTLGEGGCLTLTGAGTVAGQDPSLSGDKTFVAEGYVSYETETENTFVLVAEADLPAAYTVRVGTAAFQTLRAALDAARTTDTIELHADAVYLMERERNEDFKDIPIEGNDHTITFRNKDDDTAGGVYHDLMNVNLTNATVVDETFYNAENGENAWEFTYLELYGDFVNVVFEDGIMSTGDSTFTECTFKGHNNDSSEYGNETMYGAWVLEGDATFTECTFTGTRGLKVHAQYGESETGYSGQTIVDGCRFEGLSEKPGVALGLVLENTVTIRNSVFINCQPGDQGHYIYEADGNLPIPESNEIQNN